MSNLLFHNVSPVDVGKMKCSELLRLASWEKTARTLFFEGNSISFISKRCGLTTCQVEEAIRTAH